jgi:flagellar assembly protein FliH
MSSSPRQVSAIESAIEVFEYPESGSLALHSTTIQPSSNGHGGNGSAPDLQRLLAEAKAQGIHEGLQQAQQNGARPESQELARVAEAIHNFQQQAADYYSRVEVELVHLALAIAAKIMHREAQVDRMLVGALVKVALEKLQQGTKVIVHINPDEAALWGEYFQANLTGQMNIEVKSDSTVKPRNCVLETELGETEIGLEAQLKEIERGFFDLLAQRPDSK